MKPLSIFLLIAAAFALTPLSAHAVLMPAGANDQDYRNFGAAFATNNRAMWFRMSSLTGAASLTPINAYYGITSAHAVTGTFSNDTFTAGAGFNFNTPDATYSISEVLVHPGYDGTRNTPDIAIVRFTTPVPGITPATFGTASPGEIVSAAGYGYGFKVGDPIPTSQDGYIRAWNGEVLSFPPSASSDLYYNSTRFGLNDVSLEGKNLGGDSGGPVYNQFGQLVGLNTAQSGNGNPLGTSIYLDLAQADVLNWIQQNTPPPEPKILSLAREGADMRLVWQGKGGSNYMVQAASALGGTNAFTDLSASITLPGVGLVTTNYLDPGALTNQPARFYRIRSD